MSHFSRIATKIKDRDILVRCLEEMHYEVHEDGVIKGYHGQQHVDLSVKTGRGYAIGFKKNEEGCYDLVADWWGVKGAEKDRFLRDLQSKVQRINREYALAMIKERSEREGYSLVSEEQEEDGTIRLVVRRWS